jgi:branched-chain amino acid transport system substrate-binding protein
VLLAVACAAVVSSCGRETKTATDTANATQQVTFGCVTSLTGEGATYGLATRRGVDLALDEINGKRPPGKPRVVVVYEDDRLDATVGRTAFQKLVSVDHVPAVLGAFGSSVTLAIAPIAEQNKVVLFSASSTADEIKNAGKYIFRNVPTNRAQGARAAHFVRDHLHAKTAAILSMNNDYGVSLEQSFEPDFTKDGGRVVIKETYNPDAVDFRGQLTKIAAAKPDIVFYPGHYQESGLILKQARQLGITSTFVGGDGSYSPKLMEIAGPAAEGSYYTLMAMEPENASPDVKRFVDAFKARYHEEPDVYAAYAYDAMMTITAAADATGYTSDDIKNGLYSITYNGVTGETKFDADGEVAKPFAIYKVTNGRFERQ